MGGLVNQQLTHALVIDVGVALIILELTVNISMAIFDLKLDMHAIYRI
jgi:hypothetical protein